MLVLGIAYWVCALLFTRRTKQLCSMSSPTSAMTSAILLFSQVGAFRQCLGLECYPTAFFCSKGDFAWRSILLTSVSAV